MTFADEVSKEQVNEIVNRSRVGIMAAEKDAAPRVILEYLAANVPVVVNAELRAAPATSMRLGYRRAARPAGTKRSPASSTTTMLTRRASPTSRASTAIMSSLRSHSS